MSSRRESDYLRLEQQLQKANERAEEERRRAEEERQRAEKERHRAEKEQRTRQEFEKKTTPTTFEEYLRCCHTLLSKPLRIQTDKSLSTQGSITSPKNKPCPTWLKPWTDFPALQQQHFERIYEYIPQDAGLFSSIQFLTELGHELCDRPHGSEKDFEPYQRLAVERPTTHIISHLQKIEAACREFKLGGGIIFENHANTLSDSNEEVQQSLRDLHISSKGQVSSSNPKPRNSDQICVYKEADGTRSLCMVVEYKASHKLSIFNLRAGLLRADKGFLNIPQDVVNRVTIPTDPGEKFMYHSEWLTSAALTQTYGYMIENGLEYSYLVTAEAFVFLRIREEDPHTLYYHLAEPNVEAEAQSEVDILLCRTAVGLVLSFCLIALESKPRNQRWRNHALETAPKAAMDHEAILRQIPAEERAATPPSSVYHARIHPFKRSPIVLRPRKSRRARNSCGTADLYVHEDPRSPSDSSDETSDVETPSKPRVRTRQSGTGQLSPVRSSQVAGESDVRNLSYCTQACLLGLVRKRPLDESCPNVSVHRVRGFSTHHALDQETFAQQIRHQLGKTLDNGCEPLGKQGTRGALFKLTLASHGYTFVAKGTVRAFIQRLRHEGQVYQHLDEVQGELVPVYLGNISLIKPYFLDFGVRVVHMLLLSWAGEQARKDSMARTSLAIRVETNRAVMKLRQCGVEHGDVLPSNVLWNPETERVLLIDFERSQILKQRPVLQETSPNRKRKHGQFDVNEPVEVFMVDCLSTNFRKCVDSVACMAKQCHSRDFQHLLPER